MNAFGRSGTASSTSAPADATSPEVAKSPPGTHRKKYVGEILRLAHDPFRFAAAEQEERAQPDDFPAYFVEPDPELWQRLLDPGHFAVFGAYGSGKSTLRLNAAYEIPRRTPDVLAVTCEFAAGEPGSIETFVGQEIAKDLFIRTVERYDPVGADPERARLSREILADLMTPQLRKVARRVTKTDDGERIELLWAGLGRAPGATLVSSAPLRRFLGELLDQAPGNGRDPDLATSMRAAERLGYRAIALLADGFDAVARSTERMAAILTQLVDLADRHPGVLLLKLFLPTELKASALPLLHELTSGAPPETYMAELQWTRESLTEVFAQRFRAAQRPDILAPQDLLLVERGGDAMTSFWQVVAGSPRALLALISAAIDAHVETAAAGQLAIEPTSWNAVGT